MMFFNCPECNSDAPKKYSCPICQNTNKTTFIDWYFGKRELWWRRYEQLYNI